MSERFLYSVMPAYVYECVCVSAYVSVSICVCVSEMHVWM